MCLVGVLLGVCLSSGRAHAGGALVRWLPSPDPGTVGYRVYVRQSGTPYGAPLDLFVPPLGADGTMSYVAIGLTSGITYYFGVTAYGGDGTESGFSAELPLGPISRCAIDTCVAPVQCSFGPVADGTSCSDSDPCTVCRAGACCLPFKEFGIVSGYLAGILRVEIRFTTCHVIIAPHGSNGSRSTDQDNGHYLFCFHILVYFFVIGMFNNRMAVGH